MSFAMPEPTLPLQHPNSVIVIGAGLAGLRTVQSLRTRGFAGHITVIGAESLLPYDRPPLSKHLFTRSSPAFLSDELGADLMSLASEVQLGQRACGLRCTGQGWEVTSISLNDESGTSSLHHADAVVLALGSTPVSPQAFASAATLHTWEQASFLRERIEATDTSRLHDAPLASVSLEVERTQIDHVVDVALIGAGWIGMELASAISASGKSVALLESAESPLERHLGSAVGSRLGVTAEEHGVKLHCSFTVQDVSDLPFHSSEASADTPGTPLAMSLVSGIDADGEPQRFRAGVVVNAVGAVPNTSWLPKTVPLSPRGAVLTNQWGQAQVAESLRNDAFVERATETEHSLENEQHATAGNDGLYAVGDCALRTDEIHGQVSGGHWDVALNDPDRIAAHVLGQADSVRSTSAAHTFSTQFGNEINMFGKIAQDASVVIRDYSGDSWTALFVQELPEDDSLGLITGIFTFNSPRDSSQARKKLATGPFVSRIQDMQDIAIAVRNL